MTEQTYLDESLEFANELCTSEDDCVTIYIRNEERWFFKRARYCDEMSIPLRAFAWFLFDTNKEYVGSWETKREMLIAIDKEVAK